MLLALREEDWELGTIAESADFITAKKCYRNDPRYCVTMSFRVYADGAVVARPGRGETVMQNLRDDLAQWMNVLSKTYSNYRCYTDAALSEEGEKYGFAL